MADLQTLSKSGSVKADKTMVKGNWTTVIVNQTQHFGKGLRVCPEARIDDGMFDVVTVDRMTRGNGLALFQQLPLGQHLHNHPSLKFYQAGRATMTPTTSTVHLNPNIYAHMDIYIFT